MANREKSLLSHIFSFAIRWGYLIDNPCKHVKRNKEKKRDRYVTNAEYQSVRELANDAMKNIMDFAYLTGLRQGDVLKTKLSEIDSHGVHVETNKTNAKILFEWTDIFKDVVSRSMAHANTLSSAYLFPNEQGKKYTTSGFRTLWQRLMKKALEQNHIAERFRFHDLRRKTATDIEKIAGREKARQLLGHSDQKTTGIYISGIQRVKPLN